MRVGERMWVCERIGEQGWAGSHSGKGLEGGREMTGGQGGRDQWRGVGGEVGARSGPTDREEGSGSELAGRVVLRLRGAPWPAEAETAAEPPAPAPSPPVADDAQSTGALPGRSPDVDAEVFRQKCKDLIAQAVESGKLAAVLTEACPPSISAAGASCSLLRHALTLRLSGNSILWPPRRAAPFFARRSARPCTRSAGASDDWTQPQSWRAVPMPMLFALKAMVAISERGCLSRARVRVPGLEQGPRLRKAARRSNPQRTSPV